MHILAKIALPLSLALVAIAPHAAVAQAAPAASATEFKGKMLYGPAGERLAAVYRVGQDGSAQIIINGKMVSVPASSLAAADGKLSTSLTKRELLTAR
ncbi:hypothetical protein [Sphingobium boeckii]|uniref:Uncharacterized protein n=1 Tax=Sphingobium boeckii TaxID=1082345 RepID=A0A7W9AJQ1_9SPHN|nr:hypothetical protein [Sphingobium boeckii]MBB5686731.1 hypothetical protein [Sphingobium boeckii]